MSATRNRQTGYASAGKDSRFCILGHLRISMQTFIHYFLHFGFPLILARACFPREWRKVYFLLLATMLVDLDHLLVTPIFQANRCSIGYHYLHTYYAMLLYVLLLVVRRPFNILGLGLLLHMLTDLIDCLFMYHDCAACLADAPAADLLEALSSLW